MITKAYKCPYCGQFVTDKIRDGYPLICSTCGGSFLRANRETKEVEVPDEDLIPEVETHKVEIDLRPVRHLIQTETEPKTGSSSQNKLEPQQAKEIPTGWVCPVCGAVMAPTQKVCINCTGEVFSVKANEDPTTVPDWVKDLGTQQPPLDEIKPVDIVLPEGSGFKVLENPVEVVEHKEPQPIQEVLESVRPATTKKERMEALDQATKELPLNASLADIAKSIELKLRAKTAAMERKPEHTERTPDPIPSNEGQTQEETRRHGPGYANSGTVKII